MSPVCGVDGGGSWTRALVLGDDGTELGSAHGPAGIVVSGSEEVAADAVDRAVRAAVDEAGCTLPVDALFCGLAGSESLPGATRIVAEELRDRGLAEKIVVGTDVEAAFRDAFGPTDSGILVISGTGSVVLGRREDGGEVRVGGWGARLGDEGSGYALAVRGLRAVLRAHDGRGPETALSDALIRAAGVRHTEELAEFVETASKARVASLAPEVIRRAGAGDPVAAGLVAESVAELVEQAETAARRMGSAGFDGGVGPGEDGDSSGGGGPDGGGDRDGRRGLHGDDSWRPPVALSGGMVGPGRPFRRHLARALEDRGFPVVEREIRGERGAAALAADVAEEPGV